MKAPNSISSPHAMASDLTLAHLRSEEASWRRTMHRADSAENVLKQRDLDTHPDFGWQVAELRATGNEARRNADTLKAAIVILETR